MKNFLYPYVLIVLALAGALAGIQIPNFVRQYEQRVSAHLSEADKNLSGFQEIANILHGGSLERLIQKHEQSSDPTFRAEAVPIRNLWQRKAMLSEQLNALQSSIFYRIWFVLWHADGALRKETQQEFSPAVMLNSSVLLFAGWFAIGFVVLCDLLFRGAQLLTKIIFGNLRSQLRP